MSTAVPACIVFDDDYSVLHAFLGAVTRALAARGLWAIAVMILAMFLLYETAEDALRGEHGKSVCDVVEYIVGYIVADMVV